MPKKRVVSGELADIRRKLGITRRRLNRLIQTQWAYAKNMLKFGFAAWVFGLSSFSLITVITGAQLHGEAQPIWTSLLVAALAAPVAVAAMQSSKFTFEIKRLKRIQSALREKHRHAILRHLIETRGRM